MFGKNCLVNPILLYTITLHGLPKHSTNITWLLVFLNMFFSLDLRGQNLSQRLDSLKPSKEFANQCLFCIGSQYYPWAANKNKSANFNKRNVSNFRSNFQQHVTKCSHFMTFLFVDYWPSSQFPVGAPHSTLPTSSWSFSWLNDLSQKRGCERNPDKTGLVVV